jgi:hypothetical protein
MKKQLLTIEFRYRDQPANENCSEHKTKTITIGIFDTLEESVIEGNKAIDTLSKTFEVRSDDRFKVKGLFGSPKRLVTNTCYPTNGIQYFAKIEELKFDDLTGAIGETFEAFQRYERHEQTEISK